MENITKVRSATTLGRLHLPSSRSVQSVHIIATLLVVLYCIVFILPQKRMHNTSYRNNESIGVEVSVVLGDIFLL